MSFLVTVYNTVGQNKKEVRSSATTWGELQDDLNAAGVSHRGMSVVVGETQNTLESSQAVLPEGDFTLFLMPQKVKSGWTDLNDLVDNEEGIEASDVNGFGTFENSVEDYTYINKKEVLKAIAAKTQFYINVLIGAAVSESKFASTSKDPEVANLDKKAQELMKNLNIFD